MANKITPAQLGTRYFGQIQLVLGTIVQVVEALILDGEALELPHPRLVEVPHIIGREKGRAGERGIPCNAIPVAIGLVLIGDIGGVEQ